MGGIGPELPQSFFYLQLKRKPLSSKVIGRGASLIPWSMIHSAMYKYMCSRDSGRKFNTNVACDGRSTKVEIVGGGRILQNYISKTTYLAIPIWKFIQIDHFRHAHKLYLKYDKTVKRVIAGYAWMQTWPCAIVFYRGFKILLEYLFGAYNAVYL